MQQPLSVLTMGFSPAAAVTTWRLSSSKLFNCYTYWPVESVRFQSEVFDSESVYKPQQFELSNPANVAKLPSKSFAVVILVVPTIKDVVRMCRRLQPVLSKSSLVLVDVSGGIAPLQRLVRTNLGSGYQVCGMICDIDAEFTSQNANEWTVVHRKLVRKATNGLPSNQQIITLEPSAALAKVTSLVETALSSTGLITAHSKTPSSFGELQWQRTIGVVVFEVLTVALDIPEPEKLSDSLIAKPIIEGLIGELHMIAIASGIKGLPSRSQLTSRGPDLARRAPGSFQLPNASRCYYDAYRKAPIALDFLVLLPILLSDELPKGGATPYLESLYAYMARVLELNSENLNSLLFARADSINAREITGPQIDERTKLLDHRESDINAMEARCKQDLNELRIQQQQYNEKSAQLDRQTAQHQRRLESFEELNERAEKLRLREEAFSDLERKFGQRERALRQREMELTNREQSFMQRDHEVSQQIGHNSVTPELKGETSNGNNDDAKAQNLTSPSNQVPMTPGGTVYSRFDPRAPPIPVAQPQLLQQQQHQQNININNNSNVRFGSSSQAGQNYGSQSHLQNMHGGMQNGHNSPYGQSSDVGTPLVNRPQSRSQAPGLPVNMYQPSSHHTSPPHPHPSQALPQNRRRQTRHFSADETDIISNSGRRRQQNSTNGFYQNPSLNSQSAIFSQNFQLDSVMGSATDRYHFVSRARNKPKDSKLSSNEDIQQAKRKFLHGGAKTRPNTGLNGNASNQSGYAPSYDYSGSIHSMSMEQGGAYPEMSRSFNPGDLSGASMSSNPRRSIAGTGSLLPSNIVPNTGVDFGGFQFGDSMDSGSAGVSGGSSGSNNPSSTDSNGTPIRGQSRTPPTPQGTMDPSVLQVGQKWNSASALPYNLP